MPYSWDRSHKEANFMWQLKNAGIIDHIVVSFYVRMESGNSSVIKFGSYDESGIEPGNALKVFKTLATNTWSLRANNFKLGTQTLSHTGYRQVSLEPQLPYLYLPNADFQQFREKLTKIIGTPICSYGDNVCKFQSPCPGNPFASKMGMKIRIYDTIRAMDYTIDGADLLIPAKNLGDSADHCYVGVFKSTNADQQTWYLGNLFMKKYYVVFDMTPLDELNRNYIQVGIAPQNHKMIIGEEHYDPSSPDYKPEDEKIDESTEIDVDDGKVDPYDDDDYEKHEHDRDEEIDEHNADINEDDVDPEDSSFMEENKVLLIIGGTVILMLIIGAFLYCCRQKQRHDSYMSKAYSQVDVRTADYSGIQ